MTTDPTILALAQALYELDRIKKGSTLPHWENAPAFVQEELAGLVAQTLEGIPVEQQHEAWCFDQALAGWTFGPDYDPVAKTDPRLVHWSQYSDAQKAEAMSAVRTIRELVVLSQ